jgi:beta-glucanase (GH16 family)
MQLFKSLVFKCFIIFIGIARTLYCQTPANDLNWKLDTSKSDEFNGISINRAKWHILDCPSGDCCNYGQGTAFEKGNVSDSGGLLRIRADGPGYAPIPCNMKTYATGGITSDSANYTYGYFEIYAKLPGFLNNSGTAHAEKFWPTFWMAYNPSCSIHDEIDIMDECCCIYSDAETTGSGWGKYGSNCQQASGNFSFNVSPTPLCSAFHKYAAEWNTDKVVFYRDDMPYFENYSDTAMTMHPLQVMIDLQITNTCNFYPGMPFPQYYSVDYFRYYRLNLDCGTSSMLLTNADLAAYIFSVKSDITFGNGASIISLNNTDVKYFRAVNSITINGTFTAPLGSELGLIPSPCN